MSQLTGPDNTHSSIPHTNTQQRLGCSLKYLILAVSTALTFSVHLMGPFLLVEVGPFSLALRPIPFQHC
jgi:hypothetical protein